MARTLIRTVHVTDKSGAVHVYRPGDDVPKAHAAQITNPKAWDGDADPASTREAGTPPPKSGPGSGADAWRTYAGEVGVEVDEKANRDAVIAALEAAEKPTEVPAAD